MLDIKRFRTRKSREKEPKGQDTLPLGLAPAQAQDEEQEPSNEETINLPEELQILRAEVNLLVFPFFALHNREVRRRKKTEFSTIAKRGGEAVQIVWKVTANTEYGYPGPFDKHVHRTMEQMLNEMALPIRNPVTFSTYEICKRMGAKHGGWEYERIRQSLERVAATTIKAERTFYRKRQKKWDSGVFHLYDVYFKGSTLPDGTIAQQNYLFLNELYLESLNCRYVKPLDYKYYCSLNNPIAQRLYEILGVKLYGIYNQKQPILRYKYSTLCQLIPIKRQLYYSKAREKLEPAHRKLVSTGFIQEPEWEPTLSKSDWFIIYKPGPRAIEEIERFKPQERQIEAIQQLTTEDEWLAEWRAMTPEEKAEYQLQNWLMMEEALRCRPNEEEIEAKRRELLEYYSNLHLNQNN
jgi:hypothetical protein